MLSSVPTHCKMLHSLRNAILYLTVLPRTVIWCIIQLRFWTLWLFLCFFSTRGQWCGNCSHHYLHPAAGHLGECALLPLQNRQDLWQIRQARPVSAMRAAWCITIWFVLTSEKKREIWLNLTWKYNILWVVRQNLRKQNSALVAKCKTLNEIQ